VIRIDPASDQPAYLQIVTQVRNGVASGQLKPGDRLEPVRALASRLGINASTAARAYRELEREGIIVANRRRGSVIAGGEATALQEGLRGARQSNLGAIMERSLVTALAQGYGIAEIETAFDLQLASWRQRRTGTPAAERPTASGRRSRFAGSHDLALETLLAQARRADPEWRLTPSYVGSLDGLLALLHDEAILAGAHILDEETGEYNLPILRRLFYGRRLAAVTLAERLQGLIVAPGNPLGLDGVAGLAQPGLRFVNRQPGSGTRTLLDLHLRSAGCSPLEIAGYDVVVDTHLAVAEAVRAGEADVGLGLYAAARATGLGFVPVALERYDLVMNLADLDRPPLAQLVALLRSPTFAATVAGLGGYETTNTGGLRTI